MSTTIKLRRSATLATAGATILNYGEPLVTNDEYMTFGNSGGSAVSARKVLRLVPKTDADATVFAIKNAQNVYTLRMLKADGTYENVVQLSAAASTDIDTTVTAGSAKLITSGAVATAISAVAGKTVVTSGIGANSTDEQMATAKAINDFVTTYVAQQLAAYKPWATVTTNTNKLYIDSTNGLKYNNGTNWVTVPVAYS